MKPLCKSCDMTGRAVKIATGITLEQCKLKCMNDDSCLGIDYGKGSSFGKCYFNYQQNEGFIRSRFYDAWRKGHECGKTTSTSPLPGYLKY